MSFQKRSGKVRLGLESSLARVFWHLFSVIVSITTGDWCRVTGSGVSISVCAPTITHTGESATLSQNVLCRQQGYQKRHVNTTHNIGQPNMRRSIPKPDCMGPMGPVPARDGTCIGCTSRPLSSSWNGPVASSYFFASDSKTLSLASLARIGWGRGGAGSMWSEEKWTRGKLVPWLDIQGEFPRSVNDLRGRTPLSCLDKTYSENTHVCCTMTIGG